MKRIDAHQHLWTLARGDYGWLTADLQPQASVFGDTAGRIYLAKRGRPS